MRKLALMLLGLVAVVAGCGGQTTGPSQPMGRVELRVILPSSSSRAPSDIASVTVTVTGVEISQPIIKDLTFDSTSGSWKGVVDVPAGIDREFKVEAKDAAGNIVYSGKAKSDVKVGDVTVVTIHLYVDARVQGDVQVAIAFDNPYLGVGRLSVCYGPFTKSGQNPNYGSVVPESQIAGHFDIIARFCKDQWVRVYSFTHGNEHVPKYASQHNISVAGGPWIGKDTKANETEIQAAITVINQYSNVKLALVGSEVLSRGDQTEENLIISLKQVKNAVSVPVTYADTWDIWWNDGKGRPALAAEVNVIMIHCWPYWEGLTLDKAVVSVADAYNKTKTLYSPKEVIIGETGWPSGGNANGSAVPSEVNQRRFMREFVEWAKANSVPFFYFEFFDEPWKRYAEPNLVGDKWGTHLSGGTIKPEIQKIWF